MAADWHPSKGFEPLMTRLFIGASYASAARYPLRDCNVINIGLRVIKRCGMYSKEYKNWIAREHISPPIDKTINSFKEYWSGAIMLVNQMAAPALQHGYGMAAVDNDASVAFYTETMSNFGAAYAATQETIKSQAASLATMQGQLANIQQFCMAVGQQPPSTIYQPLSNNYAPAQHQRTTYNRGGRGGGQGGGRHGGGNPQPTWYGFGGAGAQNQRAPTPLLSGTKIGTTVSPMGAALTMPTQAKPAGDPDRRTTGTRPVPT
jgi:hypothetical protein